MIILIGNQKGGVGKSTLTTNLAVYLQQTLASVLLVETDEQKTLANWYEYRENKKNLYLEYFNDDLRAKLSNEKMQKYDYVLVDVAGRDSKELRSAMLVANKMLVPFKATQCDLDVLPFISDIAKQAKQVNKKLKVFCFINMLTTHHILKKRLLKEAKQHMKDCKSLVTCNSYLSDRIIYQVAYEVSLSVLETKNETAYEETENLFKEILS